jgi:radical SAM superfamily enzyme YgiQ (UPF0313 family)
MKPLKTLFLNPPSFERFDGGASSRWPATRDFESYQYPVWLSYPAGLLEGSRLVDAPPHHLSWNAVVDILKNYEFLVLFTSTVGWDEDQKMAEVIKQTYPTLRIAFVGPSVTTSPRLALDGCSAIDFVCRREFEFSIVEYAYGAPLNEILGVSYRNSDGIIQHNPDRAQLTSAELDALPWATEIYHRDLDITKYNIPFLLHPFVSLFSTRGCPAQCTFELCKKLKPLGLTWSCNSRVTTDFETLKAMKEAGCRLLAVGFESGDPQILTNIKKGATVQRAHDFVKDCRDLGLVIHGDFILGLPGETRESIQNTIRFAKHLDCETIQVSAAHAFPGTEFFDFAQKSGFVTNQRMEDGGGHQLAEIEYPGLPVEYVTEMVNRFYDEYYFRPEAALRIVRKAIVNRDVARLYAEARSFMRLREQGYKEARKMTRGSFGQSSA